jgi:hypothetical protein
MRSFVTLLYITKLLSGIDLFPFEKEILHNVNLDDVFSGMTGYSLMSFPDSVLDLCYRCNPKLPSQKEQNENNGYLEKPINDMGDGFKKVFSIFHRRKIIYAGFIYNRIDITAVRISISITINIVKIIKLL